MGPAVLLVLACALLAGAARAFHVPGSGFTSVANVRRMLHVGPATITHFARWLIGNLRLAPAQFRPPSCMVHVGYGDVLKVHYMVRARPASHVQVHGFV